MNESRDFAGSKLDVDKAFSAMPHSRGIRIWAIQTRFTSSSDTFFRFPAAARTISLPTSVEVNATLSTSGCAASAAPAVSPYPVTIFRTPGRKPRALAGELDCNGPPGQLIERFDCENAASGGGRLVGQTTIDAGKPGQILVAAFGVNDVAENDVADVFDIDSGAGDGFPHARCGHFSGRGILPASIGLFLRMR